MGPRKEPDLCFNLDHPPGRWPAHLDPQAPQKLGARETEDRSRKKSLDEKEGEDTRKNTAKNERRRENHRLSLAEQNKTLYTCPENLMIVGPKLYAFPSIYPSE